MSSFAFLALLGVASAAKVCTNVTVPVYINARQAIFDVPTLESNLDAVKFSLDFTNIGMNYTDVVTTGFQTVTGSYNISAKYCKPQGDNKANPTVQVLTHGIGFDKSYWDLSYNNYNYSYIDVAVAAGYHTVSIDRFGIGNSSHADPLNIVQAPAEVSALHEITSMLRNGTFPSVSHKFGKVVHVGHSFGSLQSYLLTALYPGSSDGVVLTGFSMNATWLGRTLADWNLHLARLNSPLRFGNQSVSRSKTNTAWLGQSLTSILQSALGAIGIDLSSSDIWQEIATTELGDIINGWNATVAPIAQNLPTGYLTWSDLTSNIYAFLNPGYFDVGAALFAESTKQPVTLGEIFTLGNGAPATTPHTGPALVLTGNEDTVSHATLTDTPNDAIYCGTSCVSTGNPDLPSIPAGVAAAFPNASKFEAYIQPNTGHGINFHYNATAAYAVIQNFLSSNGLQSS
ncbi:alpha/beta-hydrolase [Aureobasidium sp. EXF-12298]|nr:alpha/beta-hydrolase [Aureobasidium sp. EXF-12298]